MKRLLTLWVFVLLLTPLHAQDTSDTPELTPLEITAIYITRADDDLLTLEITGVAATCGELITTEWYADVNIEFIITETVDTIPAGDQPTRLIYQRYINITLATSPADEDGAACDLDARHVVTMELPRTITMPNVPNYVREPDEDWNVVLLVNDFAGWFYLADDVEGDDAEKELQPARGQAVNTGETALTRWQKVDSVIERLYSIGANPGYLIPWMEGYHPDGCEAPTLVNIVRDAYMRDPIDHDHYTFSVFRLLPPDSICTDEIQPFVVSAFGVLPQRDLMLSFGGLSFHFSRSDGTLTPVDGMPIEPEP